MSWTKGILLVLRNSTESYGKYPGDSVFLFLGLDPLTAAPVVLTPHGTKAAIPWQYLVPLQDGPQEATGAHPAGR